MKVEYVLNYLQKLKDRLPEKIKKKRELDRVNKALDLTRDTIILDVVIKNRNRKEVKP